MESILTSIKKLLGVEEEYTHFDQDIIIYINGVLLNLNQIGVGPSEGFSIKDKEDVWESFIGNRKDLEAVKSYVYLKTRIIFDPPQTSVLLGAIEQQIKEIEWRLTIQV